MKIKNLIEKLFTIKIWKAFEKKTSLLIIIASMFFAITASSQEKKITIQLKNKQLSEILNEIESKSGYTFLVRTNDVNLKEIYSIDAKNKGIEQILNDLFKSKQINFEIKGKNITVFKPQKNTSASSLDNHKKITGLVTDSNGDPIIGATVKVEGSNKGTITDLNGKFNLDASFDDKLIISYIGYTTSVVQLQGKSDLKITLMGSAIVLDEVVAIGYGTARKRDLIGSVSSVNATHLKDIPISSAAQAITGRMAGVQVTQTEGSPDADIKIRVRGGGSLTQDNSPLFIVDGFPVDNIKNITPSDIESIDVLKDASSTAIYGARGANGVILITTKGGYDGKAKVSYNNYFGIKEITKTLDMLNPYEYVLWQYEINTDQYFERYFGSFQDFGLYKQMNGTNWQKKIFGRQGTNMNHSLSFTGGNKVSKYNISLTRNDDKAIMIGSGSSATNFTVKTTNKINNWLTIDLNSRLSDLNIDGAGTSAYNFRMSSIVQYRPINGLLDYINFDETQSESYDAASAYILNPLKQTNDDFRKSNQLTFNFNGAAAVQLSKNLTYRFEFGTQYGNNKDNRFLGLNTYDVFNFGLKPIASITKTAFRSYRMANILNYAKKDFLPGSNINAMVGEELNYSHIEDLTNTVRYLPKYIDASSALSMMGLGTPDPVITNDYPDVKGSSLFGRVMYDYKGKYLASATLRADGSSKFAPGHQWGLFPSLGLAWRISDEKFLTKTNQWLSDLKLRASMGSAGNNRISNNAWLKTYTIKTAKLFAEGNETTPTTYLRPDRILSNPDLKWETTITRNFGLDFGLLKQRISGTVEIYENSTKDLLINATIPTSTGYNSQWQNIGQTSNKGVEISLKTNIIEKKDFNLALSFNIGFNKNRIVKLGDTKRWEQSANWTGNAGPTGDYLIQEGGSIGQIYGYETDGMYTFNDFDYNNGIYTLKEGIADDRALLNPKRFWPGTLKLKDQDGDGIVNAKDKVIIGNTNPKHSGGFNLTSRYKGFDLSAFFNWVYGNNIYNANKLDFTTFMSGRAFKNMLNIMNSENRFTYISQETGALVSEPTELAELNKNATIWSPYFTTGVLHSWVIEDGSFLRFNNLTLGYSLNKELLKRIKFSQLRLYATVYNVWTWTKYTGFDPEVDTMRSTPLTPGVDYAAYPKSRSFNIGMNIEF